MSIRVLWHNLHSLSAVASMLALSACSTLPESPVPGDTTNAATLDKLPVSTVLAALKCDLYNGLKSISHVKGALKAKDPNGSRTRIADGFNFFKGTAKLTVKAVVVGKDDGTISLAVPVGISSITPKVGGALTSTATTTVVRDFAVSEKAEGASICEPLEKKSVIPGNFLEETILAAFYDTINIVRQGDGNAYTPELQSTELSVTANFKVQRTLSAGVDASVLFNTGSSSPTLTPGLTLTNDQTAENTINVTFPMLASNPGDDRRIIFCRHPDITICLESAYDEKKHKKFVVAIERPKEKEPTISPQGLLEGTSPKIDERKAISIPVDEGGPAL